MHSAWEALRKNVSRKGEKEAIIQPAADIWESGEKADKQQESKSVRDQICKQTKYVNNIHCWPILNKDALIYAIWPVEST